MRQGELPLSQFTDLEAETQENLSKFKSLYQDLVLIFSLSIGTSQIFAFTNHLASIFLSIKWRLWLHMLSNGTGYDDSNQRWEQRQKSPNFASTTDLSESTIALGPFYNCILCLRKARVASALLFICFLV